MSAATDELAIAAGEMATPPRKKLGDGAGRARGWA